MGSWMRSEPRTAMTCGLGGPGGRSRSAGAGALVWTTSWRPDPKAVIKSVTSSTRARRSAPAVRRIRFRARTRCRCSSRASRALRDGISQGTVARLGLSSVSAGSASSAMFSSCSRDHSQSGSAAALRCFIAHPIEDHLRIEHGRQAMLAARGAGRRFGDRTALEPTTLEIRSGEAVALLGPNGAGKSTLLALLAGGLEPTWGHIDRTEGVNVGWTPQRPAHYGRLSARENLELFARLEGVENAADEATRLLDEFELPDEPQPSARLSVGNRQRLNLAVSLIGSPDVLLLDEPTASLDPSQRRRIWETVSDVCTRGGAA